MNKVGFCFFIFILLVSKVIKLYIFCISLMMAVTLSFFTSPHKNSKPNVKLIFGVLLKFLFCISLSYFLVRSLTVFYCCLLLFLSLLLFHSEYTFKLPPPPKKCLVGAINESVLRMKLQ